MTTTNDQHQPRSQLASSRRYASLGHIAEHLWVSPRTAHDITCQPDFPKAVMLAPRVKRWILSEVDEWVATRAPRATEIAEPAQLQRARQARVIVKDGRISKVVAE